VSFFYDDHHSDGMEADENVGLETLMKDEKSVVSVVRDCDRCMSD